MMDMFFNTKWFALLFCGVLLSGSANRYMEIERQGLMQPIPSLASFDIPPENKFAHIYDKKEAELFLSDPDRVTEPSLSPTINEMLRSSSYKYEGWGGAKVLNKHLNIALKNGADPNSKSKIFKYTPIMHIVANRVWGLHYCDLKRNTKDRSLYSLKNRKKYLKTLINYGGDISDIRASYFRSGFYNQYSIMHGALSMLIDDGVCDDYKRDIVKIILWLNEDHGYKPTFMDTIKYLEQLDSYPVMSDFRKRMFIELRPVFEQNVTITDAWFGL